MALTLPPLPYAYDALAPYMSKETLEFHHDKHHNAYVTAGTPMVADGTKYAGKSLEDICKMAFAAKDQPAIQPDRPALQPHALLELDEEGRRRQETAG